MRTKCSRVASSGARVVASLNTGHLESSNNYLDGYVHAELLEIFERSVGAVGEKS